MSRFCSFTVMHSCCHFFFCMCRPRHALLLSKAEKEGKKHSLTNSWKIYSFVSFDWKYAFCPLLYSVSVRLLFRVDIFFVRFVSFDNRMKSRVCMFKAIFIFSGQHNECASVGTRSAEDVEKKVEIIWRWWPDVKSMPARNDRRHITHVINFDVQLDSSPSLAFCRNTTHMQYTFDIHMNPQRSRWMVNRESYNEL